MPGANFLSHLVDDSGDSWLSIDVRGMIVHSNSCSPFDDVLRMNFARELGSAGQPVPLCAFTIRQVADGSPEMCIVALPSTEIIYTTNFRGASDIAHAEVDLNGVHALYMLSQGNLERLYNPAANGTPAVVQRHQQGDGRCFFSYADEMSARVGVMKNWPTASHVDLLPVNMKRGENPSKLWFLGLHPNYNPADNHFVGLAENASLRDVVQDYVNGRRSPAEARVAERRHAMAVSRCSEEVHLTLSN